MENLCPLFTNVHLDISTTQGQVGATLVKYERLHLGRDKALQMQIISNLEVGWALCLTPKKWLKTKGRSHA